MSGIQVAYLSYVIVSSICALSMALLWAQNRGRQRGLALMAAGLLLHLAGAALAILRASILSEPVILLSNSLVLVGAASIYAGVETCVFGVSKTHRFNLFVLAIFGVFHAYFTLVNSSLPARNINLSLAITLISGRAARELFFKADHSRDFLPRRMGVIFTAYAFFAIARIAQEVILPPSEDFFHQGNFNALFLVANQSLLTLLTFSLFILVGRKVFVDMASDIKEQKGEKEEARRQYEFQSALQEITYDLISDLDLNILLLHIVQRAEALVGTESGQLDLVNFETATLDPYIGLGALSEALQHTAALGEGMAGKVWQTGKPLVVNDYDHWEGRAPNYSFNTLGAVAGVPLLSGNTVLGVLGLAYSKTSAQTFSEQDLDHLTQFARLATIAIENTRLFADFQSELAERKATERKLQKANEQLIENVYKIRQLQESLQEQAIRDHLTGLYNRHYMEDALQREYARAQRENSPLSVILLDLDHLKELNSRFGHIRGGDVALRALSEHLKRNSRLEDILCRYGGDEFLILLHDTPAEVACARVEAWLMDLRQSYLPYNDISFRISFSAGVAAFPAHASDIEDILLAADLALYQAKEAGRSCVRIYKKRSG